MRTMTATAIFLPSHFSPSIRSRINIWWRRFCVRECLGVPWSSRNSKPADLPPAPGLSDSPDSGATGRRVRRAGGVGFSGRSAAFRISRKYGLQRSCDILLHLVKCLKILGNRKSNLSLRASRFHSWRLRLREPRQLQRAFVAKLSSAWVTATLDIHHGSPDIRSFHGRDRNLPRCSWHHLRAWNGFTLNQVPHRGDTHSQPSGSLLERETVRRDTTRIVGGQLMVVPQRAHLHFAPAIARTG